MRRFILTYDEGTRTIEVQVDAETPGDAKLRGQTVALETLREPRLTGIRFGSRVIPATTGRL